MKKLIIFIIFLFVNIPTFAEELNMDDKAKALCNQVMLDIYNDILNAKNKYPELAGFGDYVLSQNQYGIYSIQYRKEIWDSLKSGQQFEFGVTIVKSQDENIFGTSNKYAFDFALPILGLQFVGYEVRSLMKQYDIKAAVKRHVTPLLDYQQQFMPIQLTLKPLQEYYKVGEGIDFSVTLTNYSPNKAISVKDLNDKTLFFIYGNLTWGVKEDDTTLARGVKEIILRPGESIVKRFRGNPFLLPREVEIYCSYIMTFQGVKPVSKLKISIIKEPPS